MPSWWRVLLIVAFWATSMGFMAVRELLPRYRAGEPPPFTIDLIDEVGANIVEWHLLHDGRRIGLCFSHIRRLSDRNFELGTVYKFDEFPFLSASMPLIGKVTVTRFTINYEVTLAGRLRRVFLQAKATPGIDGELVGTVEEGRLRSKGAVRLDDKEIFSGELPEVAIPGEGGIVNSMHLQNRIPGLWVGRTWIVPLIDSLSAIAPVNTSISRLHAEVFADTVEWFGKSVDCFRIDHSESEGKSVGRVWVRKSDGLVIKQDARHAGREIVVIRVPST